MNLNESNYSSRRGGGGAGDTHYGTPALGAAVRQVQEAQLKAKLAELERREQTLRLRELDLDRRTAAQKAAHESAQREIRQAQQRLEARSNELDAQSVDLVARSAKLATLDRQLEARAREQQQVRDDLEKVRQQLEEEKSRERRRLSEEMAAERHALAAEIAQRREALERERQATRARIGVIRQHEQDLEQRVQSARDEIVRTREIVQRERAEGDQHLREIDARRKELEARDAELQRLAESQKVYEEELKNRIAEEKALKAEFEGGLAMLVDDRAALDRARDELEGRDRELRERQRAAQEMDRRFNEQVQELENRARAAQQAEASLAGRRAEIEQADAQIRARRTELDAVEKRLRKAEEEAAAHFAGQERAIQQRGAELEAELRAQHAEVEAAALARHQQTEANLRSRQVEVEATLERVNALELESRDLRNEAQAWKEQLEARESEARQAALTLEIEKQQIDQDRAQIAVALEELDGRRATREVELEGARAALREQAERLMHAQHSVMAAPRHWGLRGLGLAALVALAAGWGWWQLDRPRYRSSAALEFVTTSPAPLVNAQQHATALWSLAATDSNWKKLQDGGAALAIRPDGERVVVDVSDADAQKSSAAAASLATAYRERVNGVPDGRQLPPEYAGIQALRTKRAEMLKDAEIEQAQLKAELALQVDTSERAARVEEARRLETEHSELMTILEQQRARLANLTRTDAPRGTITPAELQRALDADDIYAEDLKELRVTLVQYRTEFNLALGKAAPLLRGLDDALTGVAKAVQEQRDLKPPVSIAAILEDCSARLNEVQRPVREAREITGRVSESIQREADEDGVNLVRGQNECSESARRLLTTATEFYGVLRKRVEEIASQDDGGTRNVVIAAVLRGELGSLAEAIANFKDGAHALDLLKNFRLDAHDRQLRGISNRLDQRRTLVRQQLQIEADKRARERRDQELTETRATLAAAETQRDAVVASLARNMDALRALDDADVKRRDLSNRLGQMDETVSLLTSEIEGLDSQLANAESRGPKPDRVPNEPVIRSEQIAGTNRLSNALVAGGAAFGATLAVCLLMIVRLQRSRDILPQLQPLLRPGPEAAVARGSDSSGSPALGTS